MADATTNSHASDGRIIVGIDIGNSTTEAIILRKSSTGNRYVSGGMTPTTGVKGTIANVAGCIKALNIALEIPGGKADAGGD